MIPGKGFEGLVNFPTELSVIVPTYNERPNIKLLFELFKQALKGIQWEVVFVDDDSPDGTAEEVRSLAKIDSRVRCIQRLGRKGLASACVEGMLATVSPYIAVIDGDLQHDVGLLGKMLQSLKDSGDDIVIASRYIDGGSTGSLPSHRVFISRAACWLSEHLLNTKLSDPMSGYFMLRRSLFERNMRRLYGKGFKILLDIMAASDNDVRYHELPYHMQDRKFGESKLGFQVISEYFMLILYRLSGRVIPARFFLFASVGLIGLGVHMATLTAVFHISQERFVLSQLVATLTAMTSNFILNNAITYSDKKLRGKAFFRGLISFYLACSIGAFISLALSSFLFDIHLPYLLAGLTGAAVAAVWNFLLTSMYTWGGKKIP